MKIREILHALMILISAFVIFSAVWSYRYIEVEARIVKIETWMTIAIKLPPVFFHLDNGERVRVSHEDFFEYREGDLFTYRKSLADIYTPRLESKLSFRGMSLIGIVALIVLTIFLGLSIIATEIRNKGERGIFLLIDRKAEIGIILLACSFPAWFLVLMWVTSLPLGQRYLPSNVRDTMWGFLNVFAIAGLLLYIVGRKRFLNRTRKHRIMPAISLSFGLFLSIIGFLYCWAMHSVKTAYAGKFAPFEERDLFMEYLVEGLPSLLYVILLIISGIILAIDSWKILSAMDQKNTLTKQQ